MQRLIANFSGRAQRRTENGRSWLVAPVSMIVPGVLAGSKGPLHYPAGMVARNAGRWNGIPLTLGHPSDVVTNSPLSASDRGVVDRLGLGVVRNDKFVGGKHRAEAWFDEEKTKKIAPNVYNALVEGRPMEVSTGLFTQEVEQSGVTNGRSYTHVVMGYTPDHLAILPDQVGACSVRDGCGLNVHNAATTPTDNWCNQYGGDSCSTGVAEKEHSSDAIPSDIIEMFKKGGTKGKSEVKEMSKGEGKEVRKAYGYSKKQWKNMKLFPGLRELHRDLYKEGHQEQMRQIVKKSPNIGAFLGNSSIGPDYGDAEESRFVSVNGTLNATSMPAIPHPADNSTGTPAPLSPPSTSRTDVGAASPPPPAATSSGLGPTIAQPPSPATPPPSARTDVGMSTPPPMAANDSDCPCGGECKSCKAKTQNAGCSCGGTCNGCKSKMVENDCPAAPGEEKGENQDSPDTQPRCPVKKTFQPKGFKGKGRGEAHVAAREGMADTGTTNSLNDDRSSAGHSIQGGSSMDRKQMIQYLTTNCDCYKGKSGAVLINMTDEQLSELITNAQTIAAIRGLDPQFGTLATNAMPAALKAAMDKKAAPAASDHEEPDGDEEEEEDAPAVPVMKGKAPPTGNAAPRTTEQWLKTAPPDVQRLVRNSLARERAEKEKLIDVLVANVQHGPAKAALVANYLKMDVELLKAQVDSLPTSNAISFDGGIDVPAPNYFGGGFGVTPTANRFTSPSSDGGLETGALMLPSTAVAKN